MKTKDKKKKFSKVTLDKEKALRFILHAAAARESKIEKAVCDHAKSKGWLVYKWSSPGNRGVPDRLFIRKGYVLFIEFKRKGGKTTPIQELIHKKFLEHEFKVHLIDNIEDGKLLFSKYDNLIG